MTTAAPVKRRRPLVLELPFLVALAVALALVIKAFLLQAFSIPSGSMERTLHGCEGCNGDRVLVNKLVYDVRDIHRGEIVVFNGRGDWEPEAPAPERSGFRQVGHRIGTFLGVASDDKDFIKRVIGLPGDRVMCCSPDGKVVVQPKGGEPVALEEPYLFEAEGDQSRYFCAGQPPADKPSACPPGSQGVLVPEGRLWVMGDHRGSSADSRAHFTDQYQGTIAMDSVVGRAFLIVWPPQRFGVLEVPTTFTSALGLPGSQLVLGAAGALPVTVLRRRRKLRAA